MRAPTQFRPGCQHWSYDPARRELSQCCEPTQATMTGPATYCTQHARQLASGPTASRWSGVKTIRNTA